ncbi:DUF503 domain-containing protein [Planctomycetota bacterium]
MGEMVVGAARVRLLVRGARSLKDKRKVVRSVKDRLPALFRVAVAEVADLDSRQTTVLGLSAVGNDGKHVLSVLQKAIDKLRAHPEAEVVLSEVELFRL